MSTGSKSHMSLRQKAKSMTERIDAMENNIKEIKNVVGRLVETINKTLGSHPPRLSALEEITGACMDLLGLKQDDVEVRVKENRQAIAKVHYEKTLEAIDGALSEGTLEAREEITEGTLVFVLEKSPDGTPVERDSQGNLVFDGHVEVEFSKLKPESKTLLEGKKVGESVTLGSGNTLAVEAVYMAVPDKVTQTAETVANAMDTVKQVEEASAQ